MSDAARSALVGLAAFLASILLGFLLLAATGGAGRIEVATMTVLACMIGSSAAVVHRRRAASRRSHGT